MGRLPALGEAGRLDRLHVRFTELAWRLTLHDGPVTLVPGGLKPAPASTAARVLDAVA
ncbi:MAG TPA: hypothetical protein VLT62_12085 [Candidatus Methylomirabilis sp.]|nr:hypothetical protein [Candidatus Methylomirabilis sp.]